jgi:alanyl-tRNA synthetase
MERFFSKEICGGEHIDNVSKLESFKIIKEESSSRGVRRIKANVKENIRYNSKRKNRKTRSFLL